MPTYLCVFIIYVDICVLETKITRNGQNGMEIAKMAQMERVLSVGGATGGTYLHQSEHTLQMKKTWQTRSKQTILGDVCAISRSGHLRCS
jgi:hypothetical protein